MSRKPTKVAVVGAGHVGVYHAGTYKILPGVELCAVCDTIPEKANSLAGQLRTRGITDYRELLGLVDAVSISTPTPSHYAVAMDFLRSGIHVLVEKPLAVNLRQADELIRLAARKGLILQVGHVERFNSAFRTVKKMLRRPAFIECHRLGPFRPSAAVTGVVLDLMIHDIDIVLAVVGSGVKRVDAVGVSVLTPFEDIANARIRFENGCVCNLTASRLTQSPMRKIRIFDSDAYISLDYVSQEAELHRKTGSAISRSMIDIEKQKPLEAELREFTRCVRAGRPPEMKPEEAREALALALRIERLCRKATPR